MDEEPLESWPDADELPLADVASPQDLARAIRVLEVMASGVEGEGCPEDLRIEQYRRIRRVADWICAATTTLTAPAGDLPGALDAWDGLEPGELSHALLIATLMSKGGSHIVPSSVMTPDALAGRDGALHAAALEQLPNGLIRISVCPRPDTDFAGTVSDST
ncbi:hypothetical protein [Streptomyces sp. IB201691-2A2]|uniref:hypothetical protein n=1 Tax=Streptomyces sp. IB201691-2A2 TaxID=2561920 RepID=UPI00117FDE2B|nr:hypothetical protein [Streptomyces sp. IB201691-2A2]TRO55316.1 hypothetical protein E4K73_50870 [Streptomyces sp. IB201691-2A2]